MNKWIGSGRLARDVESRYTQNGKHVATVTIAVDRKGKKGEADFIPLVAWDKSADFLSKYFTKGKQILVEGHIQVRQYEQNGQKRYATEIIVESMDFVGSKSDNAGQQAPQNYQSNSEQWSKPQPGDDDIPF